MIKIMSKIMFVLLVYIYYKAAIVHKSVSFKRVHMRRALEMLSQKSSSFVKVDQYFPQICLQIKTI